MQDGAIPKSDSKSAAGAADAKAKGLCFQSNGRKPGAGAAGV